MRNTLKQSGMVKFARPVCRVRLQKGAVVDVEAGGTSHAFCLDSQEQAREFAAQLVKVKGRLFLAGDHLLLTPA